MQMQKKEHIKSNILQPIDFEQQAEGEETKFSHRTIREDSTSYSEYKPQSTAVQQKSTVSMKNYTSNSQDIFQNNIYKTHIKGPNHLNTDDTTVTLNENYLEKDNKRLKVKRTFESKQTNLTQFYSVVKSVNGNSSGQNTASECINKQFSSKYATINEFKNPSKKKSILETLTSKEAIIKNEELENYNLIGQHSSDGKIESKKTFDEVCDDILTKLTRKRKMQNITTDTDSNYNTFLKSFSTGYITEQENYENVNCVPITEREIINAERQRKSTKTEFDKFLDKLISKIKHNEDKNNTNPDMCNTGTDKVNGKSLKDKEYDNNILQPIDFEQQADGDDTKFNRTTIREYSTSYSEYKPQSKAVQQKATDVSIKNHTNNKQDIFQNNIYETRIKGPNHLNTDDTTVTLNENYLEKNNKKLKVNRTFESKQTNLTQFYSVVKSVNGNSSGQNTASEFINKQFSSNYATINEFKNPSKNKSSLETLTSKGAIIKNEELKNSSDVKIDSNKTFDEVCDDILIKLTRKRKMQNITTDSNYNTFLKSLSTGYITEQEYYENVNSVPITEREIINAERQRKSTKTEFDKFLDKLISKIKYNEDKNKTNPDMCNTGTDKVNGKSLKDIPVEYDNNENCYSELIPENKYSTQFTQNCYSHSIQIPRDQCINENNCHNTEICSMNIQYLEKEQNRSYNLSTLNLENSVEMQIDSLENNLEKSMLSKNYLQNDNKRLKANEAEKNTVSELKKAIPICTSIKKNQNPDQESGNTKVLTSKGTNLFIEDSEIYKFVVPSTSDDKTDCTKTFKEFSDHTKLPKITHRTHLLLKSFSTGDKIGRESHENVNSVPITEYETKNAKRQLESSKTGFDKFFDIFLNSIEQNEDIKNKATPDIHQINIIKASDKSLEETAYYNSNENNEKCYTEPAQKYDNFIQFTQNDSQSLQSHQSQEYIQNNEEICTMNTRCLETEHDSTHYPSIRNLENSIEMRIDSLKNDLEKSILNETLKKYNTSTEKSKEDLKPDGKSTKLDNFIKNMIINIEKKDSKKFKQQKNKFLIKRYKKGKTKIYRLKKSRRKHLQIEEVDENLEFNDILEKVTSGYCESQPRLPRYPSGTSISTSSCITDETKSENLSTGSEELPSPQRRLRNGFNELSKDKSLCYAGKEWEDATEHDKECLKMKLQDIFFQILQDFKDKKPSYFKHRRQSFDNCIFKDGRLQLKPPSESSVTIISSKVQNSKPKFQIMLHILKKIQTLLEDNTKLTKREVYYQLKEFISDQKVSDRAINAISCLLDVGMWALNITAQKGLVFGDLKLLLSSGEMLNCNIPGTLIPQDIGAVVEIQSSAYFILVVEKESIFHKLIQDDLPNKLTRPFILITGKGFPDLNTQLFLKKLWMVMSIPVFILVDADPHGVNIMLNYRFGSVKHAHVSQHLAVPHAKWLGVYPSEIINLNLVRQPLTENDVKLVESILARPYMESSTRLVEEVNILLANKYKAGIEGLMKTNSYLSQTYLPNKFFSHNFI